MNIYSWQHTFFCYRGHQHQLGWDHVESGNWHALETQRGP